MRGMSGWKNVCKIEHSDLSFKKHNETKKKSSRLLFSISLWILNLKGLD